MFFQQKNIWPVEGGTVLRAFCPTGSFGLQKRAVGSMAANRLEIKEFFLFNLCIVGKFA